MLLVGGRLGEMPSSDYTLLKSPYPDQTLVHVHPDPHELGRVYRPTSRSTRRRRPSSSAFARPRRRRRRPGRTATEALHQSYLAWSTPPATGPGAVHMGPIMAHLEDGAARRRDHLTNGAGNYATWVHRFHRYRHFNTQAAPTSGSMGYGLPAARRRQATHPDREVVVFAGDG